MVRKLEYKEEIIPFSDYKEEFRFSKIVEKCRDEAQNNISKGFELRTVRTFENRL